MAYRVLARAYRSGTFEDLVGQEAITTTLRNAIKSGRIHHGYLFTGTRGVGKTSMARILAKALNCQAADAPTPTPCCECNSCRAIAEGDDVDVVEIDAASNTGVDNIRELRSNATLRPARSRFKIYIIDEVHMLSTGAFNALLKTLEEPPPHVKFMLATTESHKVPATIQSRCQRFDFKAMDVDTITERLRHIIRSEKLEADDAVLRRVARLANGSMRDGLSLLDMLLSFDATRLTRETLDQVVPPPHDELSFSVVDCIAGGDAAGALGALDRALQTGRTVERFCDHLIEHCRTLMLLRICGAESDLVDVAAEVRSLLIAQAERFDAPTYVYMIALLEELRRNVKFSGAARALADAAIVRLSMSSQFTELAPLLEKFGRGETGVGVTTVAASAKQPLPAPGGVPKKKAVERTPGGDVEPRTGGVSPAVGEAENSRSAVPVDAGPATRVSPADLQRAAADPFVQKVKEAFGGTLVGVRSAALASSPEPEADSDPPDEPSTSESQAE